MIVAYIDGHRGEFGVEPICRVLTDAGSQFTSVRFTERLDEIGARPSIGTVADRWDNSVAEAAWSSLQRELVHRYVFADRAAARRAIFAWIGRSNPRRRHSTLGFIPPIERENQYHQSQANQAA